MVSLWQTIRDNKTAASLQLPVRGRRDATRLAAELGEFLRDDAGHPRGNRGQTSMGFEGNPCAAQLAGTFSDLGVRLAHLARVTGDGYVKGQSGRGHHRSHALRVS